MRCVSALLNDKLSQSICRLESRSRRKFVTFSFPFPFSPFLFNEHRASQGSNRRTNAFGSIIWPRYLCYGRTGNFSTDGERQTRENAQFSSNTKVRRRMWKRARERLIEWNVFEVVVDADADDQTAVRTDPRVIREQRIATRVYLTLLISK